MRAILRLRKSSVDAVRGCRYHRAMLQPATDTLHRIFDTAQQEARKCNQEFVGIEHLALALLDDDSSEAVRVLQQMNISSGFVRNALSHVLPGAKESPIITGNLPMSPKVQRLINSALVAAQAAGREKLSSRFVLSAMLAEASGVVCETFRGGGGDPNELARALRERDVTPEA
jgi:ATP-dependent Clp protease ATP-binding subunit ClpC